MLTWYTEKPGKPPAAMAGMISPSELTAAAQAIREGKLVAFPTETVYGLGANALNADAVARIYSAKGRPASSPLIVHVASVAEAQKLVTEWPPDAQTLTERFWPGPLTLVLPKGDSVPGVVTANLSTVGIRMPAHEIALALIREAGVPIAAPSANRFTELSPTTAAHVRQSLGSAVDVILDGGPCSVGIESTVIAFNRNRVELLRPGMITRCEIEAAIGGSVLGPQDNTYRSPGQHPRHYQPRTPLFVAHHPPSAHGKGVFVSHADMPSEPQAYAAELYKRLHELDGQKLDWIAIAPVPDGPEWDGIRDRLQRAQTK